MLPPVGDIPYLLHRHLGIMTLLLWILQIY
jgi:hypothetical protein